jgi:hypothetical protein
MKLDIQGIFDAIRKFQDAIQSHIPFRIQHLHDQFDLMVRISIQSHEMMRQQMEDHAIQANEQKFLLEPPGTTHLL